jgi:hypothetical protein
MNLMKGEIVLRSSEGIFKWDIIRFYRNCDDEKYKDFDEEFKYLVNEDKFFGI